MLSHRLLYTAIAYFVIGVGLGTYMGAAQDFRFIHVHAHVNLLGWVALGIIGLIYAVYPSLAHGWWPEVHYWLHAFGLAIFMGGFWWMRATDASFTPLVPIGASMVALGVLVFALNVALKLPRVSRAGTGASAGRT